MSDSGRRPFPFRKIPLSDDIQRKVAKDFLGYPNGLASCNHWGFKLSNTVSPEELEEMYNHPLDASDVWVVTPPKCGTTWTQEMVWLIANNLDYEGAKTPLSPTRWSFVDFAAFMDKQTSKKKDGAAGGLSTLAIGGDPYRPSPRFVKSHLPMSLQNPRLLDVCKVIYVARNPKDICVSYYHHGRLFTTHDFTGELELYVDYFKEANIVLTPVLEHMIEAWNLRHHPNLCFLFYEDMKRDLRSQIRRVAKFLGKAYTDEQVDKLAQHLHIDNFKNNPHVNREELKKKGRIHKDRGNFIRKGKTGDWKNHFTPEMNAKFDQWMEERLKGTDLTFIQELDKQD